MEVMKISEARAVEIAPGRKRRILHTANLMMVEIDFEDGPSAKPDPPHAHPHEQVTFVAAGELLFFIGDESCRLGPGDMVAVGSSLPHTIQLLTERVCLVDTFTPIRQEFL